MNPKIIDNPPKMWWSGDKRVEPYMPKINEALERNGLTGDAKTDCYNRAYEAVYKAIVDATAERDRYKVERDELMEMIQGIPCLCHEGYTSRKLTDPACPRCNYIEEDIVNKIKEG